MRAIAVIALSSGIMMASTFAFAYPADQCAGERFGADLVCTAGDVSITGIAVAPGTPTACVGGTTFTADIDITVNFATPDRWDVGIFLSNDGNDPQSLISSGGASTCSVGILPTQFPFYDLDPNGGLDTCGDGNSTIGGGTGSGIVRFYNVPVLCNAISGSNGNLYIPFVVSWDNQSSPSGADCTSNLDPVPNTKSKCNAPKTSVATEVQFGTVNAVVLPDITKTDGVTSVNPGDSLTYTVVITNTTGQPLSGAVFTDPATANLTVSSVSCSASGGASCPTIDVATMQGAGATIPDMPVDSAVTFTINATVNNPVSPSYSHQIINTAEVTVQSEVNTATDTDSIIGAVYADLTTSTKSVVDLNGGEADPGDILRYTITINETAGLAVTGVSVTDDIPLYVNNFTVQSTPSGATDSSTGSGTGSNGTGYLDISNISVAANGTETIIFDVTIAAGTPAGTEIDNFATVNNPTGPGATPAAPTITVSPSSVQLTDNKQLYVYGSTPYSLSRNRPAVAPDTNSVTVVKGGSVTWNGNNPVVLQLDNTVANAYVSLYLSAANTNTRKISTRMYCSSDATAYAATPGTYDLNIPATPTLYTFNLTSLNGGFSFPSTCTAPNYWVMQVDNVSSGSARDFNVHPTSGVDYSRLNLDSSNVIYVESLGFFDDSYAAGGGSAITTITEGTTVYIRTVVSDPFGSFDISSVDIDISDADSVVQVAAGSMTEVNDSGIAEKTFEYAYTIPTGAVAGNWTVTVTANEGVEATVTDDDTSGFTVLPAFPSLTFLKSYTTDWDPVNGSTSPKDIPGADILYKLKVTNFGAGSADNLVFTDTIPANTKLFVGDLDPGPINSAVIFTDGTIASGFTASDVTVSYSSTANCALYTYSPVADADGYDTDVCAIQIEMNNTKSMAGDTNLSDSVGPEFEIDFKVRIE